MPVIRSQTPVARVSAEQRRRVAEQLEKELSGEQTQGGPVIFEIPFEHQDRIDVLVVWDAWKPFGSEERSNLVSEAYENIGSSGRIAQALGLTYQEAVEQQVLPYSVVPMGRRDMNVESAAKAMLAEGGFALGNGRVELRFPTMPLAEQAHKRLTDAMPDGYWSIVQTVAHLP